MASSFLLYYVQNIGNEAGLIGLSQIFYVTKVMVLETYYSLLHIT